MLMWKCRDISNRPINPSNKDALETPWNLILGGSDVQRSKPHRPIQENHVWYHNLGTFLLFCSFVFEMFTCRRGVRCLACSSLRPRGWRARLWLSGRRRRATMGWAAILSERGQPITDGEWSRCTGRSSCHLTNSPVSIPISCLKPEGRRPAKKPQPCLTGR